MLNIAIIAVGKIKDKNLSALGAELLKRLSPYAKIKIEELAAEPFRQESDKLKAKNAEAEKILKAIAKYPEAKIIILDERGSQLTTQEFSQQIKEAEIKQLVFVIGGTLGFSDDILKKFKNILALSKMTVTHEMARTLLIEQIYRSACLLKGKDYHY